jgi:hypothetical protein
MSGELPTRRAVRRRGWASLAKLALTIPCAVGAFRVGLGDPVAWLCLAGALYWAVVGLSGLILAALHSYVLATYRRPWL